jgi:hypothetical protein
VGQFGRFLLRRGAWRAKACLAQHHDDIGDAGTAAEQACGLHGGYFAIGVAPDDGVDVGAHGSAGLVAVTGGLPKRSPPYDSKVFCFFFSKKKRFLPYCFLVTGKGV